MLASTLCSIDDALPQPILGNQRDAVRDRVAGLGDLDRLALDEDFARSLRVDAEQHARQRAASAAQQARDADDLAGVEREIDIVAACCGPLRPLASSSGFAARRAAARTSEKPRERRPTIYSIILSRVSSDIGAVTTCRPSRRIVARSAICVISSMRCET